MNHLDLDNVSYVGRDFHDRIFSRCQPRVGDVLLTKDGANTGNVTLNTLDQPFSLLSSVCLIQTNPAALNPAFLCYYLQSPDGFKGIVGQMTGTAIKRIILRNVKLATIPLPPLPEQQRIVAILNEAFASIATTSTNTAQNIRNARELSQSHLDRVFTERGEGWVDSALAQICEVFEDGDWIESKDQAPAGIRLIQTGNVGVGDFKRRDDRARYVSEATFGRLRCTEIYAGDCLISRLPDPVGRSCLVPDIGTRMITGVDCTIVRFRANEVVPAYFVYYSQSRDYLRAVDARITGTTRSRISRSNLGQVAISVPPPADQQRIVAKLDAMTDEAQRLASVGRQKLAALDDLWQSLLHQAFSGAL